MTMGRGSRIDSRAILDAVSVFERRLDECVAQDSYRNAGGRQFDEVPVSVRAARLTITPGIRQTGGYVDVQWWENGDYRYHYQEDGLQFRFGREIDNEDANQPVHHFHPPNDPSAHQASEIPPGHGPELVTLAVIANWHAAAQRSDPRLLNAIPNPP